MKPASATGLLAPSSPLRVRAVCCDSSSPPSSHSHKHSYQYKPNWQFYARDARSAQLAPQPPLSSSSSSPAEGKSAANGGDGNREVALSLQASFKPLPAPNKNKMAIGDMENDAGASDDVDADSEKQGKQLDIASADESLSIVFGAIGIAYTPNVKPSITPTAEKMTSPRRTAWLEFSCNICGHRMGRNVNPRVLAEGTMLIECENCNRVHKIVDNLNWL